MKILGIVEEDFVNFKFPSMLISFPYCSFKCNRDCGQEVCHNSPLAKSKIIEISCAELVERYMKNSISRAVILQGLEPLDSLDDVKSFIEVFREASSDAIIVYTGYTQEELPYKQIVDYITCKNFGNIIIKYGRFIPNRPHVFNNVLGVELASNNQGVEIWE